jgi:hypothetical protein
MTTLASGEEALPVFGHEVRMFSISGHWAAGKS